MSPASTAQKPATRVVTGVVRLSYCHIDKPFTAFEGQEPKYSVVLLVPKSDKETVKKLKAAQAVALEQLKAKNDGKLPKGWKNTIHDGDEEADLDENPEYAGCIYLQVSSKTKPGLVDRDREPILDDTEVYSGCYARVSINAFAFSASGSKGVSFGLNHIQKWKDGEPFAGRSRAEDDFDDDFEGDDDDESLI